MKTFIVALTLIVVLAYPAGFAFAADSVPEKTFLNLFIEKITNFGVQAGDNLHMHWLQFYGVLFARFRDFVIMKHDDNNPNGGCVTNEVGYDDKWKERIVLINTVDAIFSF